MCLFLIEFKLKDDFTGNSIVQ